MLDIRLDDFYEERVEELKRHYREPTGSAVIRMLIRNASQEANRWPAKAGREEEGDDVAVAAAMPEEYKVLAITGLIGA